LTDQAAKHGYSGFMFDLENISPQFLKDYPPFWNRRRGAQTPGA